MIYLDLHLNSQFQCEAGSCLKPCPRMRIGAFTLTWTGVSNANVGQIAVLSHAQFPIHAQYVLPGLGPEFPNVNV
jgi:hypothetical protein